MSDVFCGLPPVVFRAMRDKSLRPAERLAMWELWQVLNLQTFTHLKGLSLAKMMGTEERTALAALKVLSARGYVEVQYIDRRTRAYRLPWLPLERQQAA